MPWISIPKYAEPGQSHAFADREEEVCRLYRALVEAGNAVRAGKAGVCHGHVVFGHMGMGKSTIILQALAMIRGLAATQPGQRTTVPEGLVEPADWQRWLILRVSGKRVRSLEGMASGFQRALADERAAETDPTPDSSRSPLYSLLDDVAEQADRQAPGVLELPIVAGLLRRREKRLYDRVRSALTALGYTIEFVRRWYGSTFSETLLHQAANQEAADLEAGIRAQVKAGVAVPGTVEAQTALKMAAAAIRRSGEVTTRSEGGERAWRVGAMQLVDPLNDLFEATDRAGIPSILVLDDFDEFTSAVGPSVRDRSLVLSWILGPFAELRPTCLVIGLREEYMHEDIRRRFDTTYVPAMTRQTAGSLIEAWSEVQQPSLPGDQVDAFRALGDALLEPFPAAEPVVNPFRFLQMAAWAYRSDRPGERPVEQIRRYLREAFHTDAVDALEQIAADMPDSDVLTCARMAPLRPKPYALTDRARSALERAGLWRPAVAGDPHNDLIVLDSLAAYLRAAQG